MAHKKILVTGAGGYIGTVLVGDLLARDYEVIAYDRYFFGDECLGDLTGNKRLQVVRKDIRDIECADLDGVYGVCDLASISNDPSGEIQPKLTLDINYTGRLRVARMAKQAGVSRYVLSSSCSVYGQGGGLAIGETAPVAPISTYARSAILAENDTLPLVSPEFAVTALRNATVFGLSRRMRFDLAINIMTLHAVQRSRIVVMGGGKQWRPFVHVRDVARAFRTVIEADREKVSGQVLNIGLENVPVLALAYQVREALPFHVEIDIAPDDPDPRNYHVSFAKAEQVLGYKAEISIRAGVTEIYDALKHGTVDPGPQTSTVFWYRRILEAKELVDRISLNGRIL